MPNIHTQFTYTDTPPPPKHTYTYTEREGKREKGRKGDINISMRIKYWYMNEACMLGMPISLR